jgi:hypothetical protein
VSAGKVHTGGRLTVSADEYYELLQLGIMLLGIVAVILAFLFVGFEKSGSK